MKIAHEVREYALSQRVSEPEALKKSTAQKRAGRAQDLDDIAHLERIRKLQADEGNRSK